MSSRNEYFVSLQRRIVEPLYPRGQVEICRRLFGFCGRRNTRRRYCALQDVRASCYNSPMIALPQHRMTADEFLAWAETQPKEAGRFELWDGEVIVKRGPTGQQQSEQARHWDAKIAIFIALREAIKKANLPCFAVPEGAGVRMANDRVFEPDAMVYCGQRVVPEALHVPNPIIVVEVLSPSTASFDHGLKLQEYFKLDTVQHYLIIDPVGPLVIHHTRGTGDALSTRIVPSGSLRLDPPGLDVDLTELFELG